MNRAQSWMLSLFACALLGSGCSEFDVKNKNPIAVASIMVGSEVIPPGKPVPYMGQPVAVTLSSAGSKDPDGSIKRVTWLRTDIKPSQRYSGNGMVDGGGLP